MSKHLAELLDQPTSLITKAIMALEDLSGYPSEDVRLLAEFMAKSRTKKTQLGLDPDDTTNKELYHALLARFEHDGRLFASDLGFSVMSNPAQHVQNLAGLAQQMVKGPEVLAIKRSVAKDLLKKTPPRRLMKKLNCRSVDSMLKHYNIAELYAYLPATESTHWHQTFWQQGSRLTASDFEPRHIEIVTMSVAQGTNVLDEVTPVSSLPQLGAIVIWPVASSRPSTALAQSLFLIEAVNNLQIYSLCLQHGQFQKNFGRLVVDILQNGLQPLATLGGQSIPWRTLRNIYKNQPSSESSLFATPHKSEVKTNSHSPAIVLAEINPLLKWWTENDYLAAGHNEHPVSLNILDVAKNYFHEVACQYRTVHHFRDGLWEELLNRYLHYPAIESYILRQLDNKQLAPETINVVPGNSQPIRSGLAV